MDALRTTRRTTPGSKPDSSRVVRALVAALGAAAILLPGAGRAQTTGAPTPPSPPPAPGTAPTSPPGATIRLSLEESLAAALRRSPETRQALAEVEGYRGKQLQALGIGRPQIELSTVLGPSPRARGNQV